MTTRQRVWPAHLLAGVTAVLTAAGLILLLLTLEHPPVGGWGFRGFPTIFAVASGTVGWLIMVRRPDNRIGLVLGLVGLLNGAQLFLTEYAASGAREGLAGTGLAASVNAFIWVPTFTLMTGAVGLVFPDGRLPSRAWRPVAWVMALATAAVVTVIAAYPSALGTPREAEPLLRLPFSNADLDRASYVALVVLGASVALAAVSLWRRWRSASGVVREQLKWLAMSVAVVVLTMPLSLIPGVWTNAVFIAAVGSVPLAVGIAVLRYRLYEIDTVISRTLVYGLLTAVLAGSFAALQRLLQAVFVSATGNESDAATVITTLILATSFTPLKGLIERVLASRLKDDGGERPAVAAADADPPERLEELLRRVVREELQASRAVERAPDE